MEDLEKLKIDKKIAYEEIRRKHREYWETDEMTPKELEEFLWDRKHIIENKIEQKLGVK